MVKWPSMLAYSFLIESSSKLLVTRTGIKAWTSLISGLWFPWPIYMFFKWDLTLAHWTQVSNRCPLGYLLYSATQKVAGNYVIPLKIFRPSISPSFPDSNLSSFWPIVFKLCMDIDIGEEWFGISNGLNLFINNRVMVLDWCKNVVSRL